MNIEIEAKFLDINFDETRSKLRSIGATCKTPMRLMKRAIIDYPNRRLQTSASNAYIRIRDEGDIISLTYKTFESLSVDGARELETVVGSFDTTVAIFTAIGLQVVSLQESRRETWEYKDCKVELDEWPWLKPYLEIEGPSEHAIKRVAELLGFDWGNAAFGDVMVAYRREYPGLSEDDTVGHLPEVKFNTALPAFLDKSS
jgi:adenylate cyclase class 2